MSTTSSHDMGAETPPDAHAAEEAQSGYKHPPKSTQFKKRQSGNPKGRPKGRRNFANLIQDALNEPVPVRSGKRVKNMATGEAVLRVLMNKAGQGNGPAISEMLRLLATTGRTTEITDEEREKRSMHLPRSLSREEMDLAISECRERDRQRYLAMAEFDESGGSADPPTPRDIKEGDKLVSEGAFENAIAAYQSELTRCKTQLDIDKTNQQAQCDFRRGVSRIGLLAYMLLESGQFQQAKDFAEAAFTEAASPFWVTPKNILGNDATNITWISVIRAHTLMFLDCIDEARRFYLSFNSNKRHVLTCWETSILQDFARLDELGHSHPLMKDIERHFAEEGWTIRRGNTVFFNKVMVGGEEFVFIQTHPDDVRAGDLLAKRGDHDDAMAVYRRSLDKWAAETAKANLAVTSAKTIFRTPVNAWRRRLARFFLAGGFGRSLECADAVLRGGPR